MVISVPFNLPDFMLSNFNRVDFGGDLFGQWPIGIRFEIGLEQVSRAVKLYEFIFGKADDCILVSQDWPSDSQSTAASTSLFEIPDVFPSIPSRLQTIEVSPIDESQYVLTWTTMSPFAFDITRMFHAIANRERDGIPAITSGVYIVEPRRKIIMHMYDDRGLDVIANNLAILRPLYEKYGEWVLDNQQHRVAFRFGTKPKGSSL